MLPSATRLPAGEPTGLSRVGGADELLSGRAHQPSEGATGRDKGSGPLKCWVNHPHRAPQLYRESRVGFVSDYWPIYSAPSGSKLPRASATVLRYGSGN